MASMAAGNIIPHHATPIVAAASAPAPSRITGAVAMLRLLLFGLVIVPPVLGGVACYVSYQYRYDAETEALAAAAGAASESTARMLDAYLLVSARINDLLGAMSPEQIHADERALHAAMNRQIADTREIAAAWVIDATGRELVSARVYPANRNLDQSGREDFTALRDTKTRMLVWILRARSLSSTAYEPYVTVSVRRASPDGRFNGVVIVAVAGSYFTSSYKSLLAALDDTVDLVRDDGTIGAQFPPGQSDQPALPDPLLAKAITAGGGNGTAERGTLFDGAGRIVAVRHVADFPLYVAVERSKASIAREWLRSIAGTAAIGGVAIVALIALTRMALRRARRETLALARAAEAFADRAALEVRLHRAQRFEGIARLATGIACEFDRLLLNSKANIAGLATSIKDVDAGQKNFVTALMHNSQQSSALIERLLGFARREPIKPQPIDINGVIAPTLEQARQFRDSITREVRPQKDLWLSCVDPDQLATTILNLMFNARDVFAETDRQVFVTTNARIDRLDVVELEGPKPGEYVRLSIESSRQGNAYVTGDGNVEPAATPKLGKDGWPSLSLVHELAQSSGGYWTVSSEPVQGTTIRIYFPRYLADRDSAEHHLIKDDGGVASRLRLRRGGA